MQLLIDCEIDFLVDTTTRIAEVVTETDNPEKSSIIIWVVIILVIILLVIALVIGIVWWFHGHDHDLSKSDTNSESQSVIRSKITIILIIYFQKKLPILKVWPLLTMMEAFMCSLFL